MSRLPTLDGLRGLAVMGILLMNVTGFALPSGAYFNPQATGAPSTADLAVWAATFVVVDGKMRALFSILFGASTALIAARAEVAGTNPTRIHLARMAVLALIGVAHGVVLWPGDVLLHYALVGTFALPLVGLEPRQQIKIAVFLLLGQAVIQGGLLLGNLDLEARAHAANAPASVVAAWNGFAANVGIGHPQAIAADIRLHRGGWGALAAANLRDMTVGAPFLLEFDGLETLAFMALGMAALSSGFFTGDWSRCAYARAAVIGLAIGWPLSALLAFASARSGFGTLATFAASTLGGIPLRPLLALSYAALAIPWLTRDGRLVERIRAAGRMAFSNYLLTSLIMTALFDGWGLGLYGRFPRAELYAIVPLLWLAMLAWSAPWLARFRYGPLEWAWRSLARGQVQPMRKAIANA